MSKQNKDQLRKKVLEQFSGFQNSVFEEGGKLDKLLNSGAIDLSEPEEGYKTASKILAALGEELKSQYSNRLSKTDKEDIGNIGCFL